MIIGELDHFEVPHGGGQHQRHLLVVERVERLVRVGSVLDQHPHGRQVAVHGRIVGRAPGVPRRLQGRNSIARSL